MARRQTAPRPSEDEILSYANVPTMVAAKFLGWSDPTLRYALREGRAPFGIAARNPDTNTWSYNIAPAALIEYSKHGLRPAMPREISERIADVLERTIDARTTAARDAVNAVLSYCKF